MQWDESYTEVRAKEIAKDVDRYQADLKVSKAGENNQLKKMIGGAAREVGGIDEVTAAKVAIEAVPVPEALKSITGTLLDKGRETEIEFVHKKRGISNLTR